MWAVIHIHPSEGGAWIDDGRFWILDGEKNRHPQIFPATNAGLAAGGGSARIGGMILRVSAAFAKQFKCVLSHEGEKVPQEQRLDAWSCHFIRVRRKPVVVAIKVIDPRGNEVMRVHSLS